MNTKQQPGESDLVHFVRVYAPAMIDYLADHAESEGRPFTTMDALTSGVSAFIAEVVRDSRAAKKAVERGRAAAAGMPRPQAEIIPFPGGR